MEVEDEAESRVSRGKRCRRSYERSTDCPLFPRKCRRASRIHCSTSCKMWRKGGTISCMSTRRRKENARDTKPPGQKKNPQKESLAAKEEVRKLRDDIDWKEGCFLGQGRQKWDGRCGDGEAELQGLQAGEKRRGSNAPQQVDCCLETLVEQVFAAGADQARSKFDALCHIFFRRFETFTPPAQMPGREGRRDSENEQEQGRISQQLMLPTPGGFIQGAPATSLELDLPLVRGVPGECGSAGRSGTQGDRKRGLSRSPGRHCMDEGTDDDFGGLVP